jgi:hypothetical protein
LLAAASGFLCSSGLVFRHGPLNYLARSAGAADEFAVFFARAAPDPAEQAGFGARSSGNISAA